MFEGNCGGQKRALETLEPELQMIAWMMGGELSKEEQ